MTAPVFAPGDMVRLKLGGDLMVIASIDQEGCHCLWRDPAGNDRRGVYPAVVLEPYVPESPVAVATVVRPAW